MRKLLYWVFAVVWCGQVAAQEDLKNYVPVLPSVRAQFFNVDPKLGYAVKDMGGGVYVISDNGWQSAFLVTDEGVIVFDAPESFGKSIPSAIAKITDKPIKMLIYSHIHKDHIGGIGGVQRHQGFEDRCDGGRQRVSEGAKRSEPLNPQCGVRREKDDHHGRQDRRIDTPFLPLAGRGPFHLRSPGEIHDGGRLCDPRLCSFPGI